MLDLADFDSKGQLKGMTPNSLYTPRSFNLARFFEHEFFGHGEMRFEGGNYQDSRNVNWLNMVFNTISEIPKRQGYTEVFSNGGALTRKSNNTTAVNEVSHNLIYRWQLPDPRVKNPSRIMQWSFGIKP
jgi:hypothetical protein